MSTYVIGDLQGCYRTLRMLLNQIQYNPERDFLWFTGDIVNRGPESLKTLQFIKNLVDAGDALTVLGNHDLHFLAVAEGMAKTKDGDTLQDILASKDKTGFVEWLRQQPLCFYESNLRFFMVHAGLIPDWTIADAMKHGAEVSATLKSDDRYRDFLKHMYGNEPAKWSENLTGFGRLRFITNVFTRIRYCTPEGKLNLQDKGALGTRQSESIPWFALPKRASLLDRIVFGHWASLYPDWDRVKSKTLFPVDSGCCWGNGLTALCLETEEYFYCPSMESPGFSPSES